MNRILITLVLAFCASSNPAQSAEQDTAAPGHYLFVWAGDRAHKGNDFLAVIDADPASASYGRLMTSLVTDQQTVRVHHTEYTMPASGMLFANDHDIDKTFIFDVRDALHPKIVTSFTDMAGFMHPHSYVRLPNGNVLVTFQHAHHHGSNDGHMGKSGGLVEIDDSGKVIRSASNADPAFSDALLMPYSLVVLPEIDRVLSTNSSMHDDDVFSGVTYQVWRLSDLKLLKTSYLDAGDNHYGHVAPEEPRLGPDGSVFVQTLACGIERITGSGDRRTEVEARPQLSRELVRRADDRGALPGPERSGGARIHRARHRRCRKSGGSLPAHAERDLQPALDRLGSEDRATRGDLRRNARGPDLPAEAGPGHGRADGRHRLSRRGRTARLQFRRARMAAWLERCRLSPRSRLHSLSRCIVRPCCTRLHI